MSATSGRQLSNGGGRSRALVPALVAAMVVPTMMPFTLGVIAPSLTSDAGLSVVQVGLLASVMYLFTSGLSPFGGRVTDGRGFAPAIAGSLVLATGGYVVLSVAHGFWLMSIAAALSGVANALANPGTNGAITDVITRPARGRALGWKQAGVPLSGLACGVVIPAMSEAWGWRTAMFILGVAVLVVGAWSLRVLVRSPRVAPELPADRQRGNRAGLLHGLNSAAFWMGTVTGAIQAYLVLHGVEVLGYSRSRAGLLMAVIGIVGALGRVAWSVAVGRGMTSLQSVRAVPMLSALAVVLVVASGAWLPWLVWPGAALSGLAIFGFSTVAMLVIVMDMPGHMVGFATGAFSRSFFGGILVGSIGPGFVIDLTGSYGWAWLTVLAEALVAIAISWRRTFLTAR